MLLLGLSPWHLWVIAGVVLLILEIFTSGFVLAGLGFGAICAAIGHYWGESLDWALLAYSIGALVFFVGIRPFALRTFMKAEPARFGIQGMIGQHVTIMDSPDMGGKYYTVFRDSRWGVESEDDLTEGDLAEVIDVRTSVFIVKRLSR
ncbi:MAG: NfeD family protein [Parahaliea sp.]